MTAKGHQDHDSSSPSKGTIYEGPVLKLRNTPGVFYDKGLNRRASDRDKIRTYWAFDVPIPGDFADLPHGLQEAQLADTTVTAAHVSLRFVVETPRVTNFIQFEQKLAGADGLTLGRLMRLCLHKSCGMKIWGQTPKDKEANAGCTARRVMIPADVIKRCEEALGGKAWLDRDYSWLVITSSK